MQAQTLGFTLSIKGVVQGVGFRPFVSRLAHELGIVGEVKNNHQGVEVHFQADNQIAQQFVESIKSGAPVAAKIETMQMQPCCLPHDFVDFHIIASDDKYSCTAIAPDRATCKTCLAELATEGDRRIGYAFNSCPDCGPRYSVIKKMPYDRDHTSMHEFPLCTECNEEYGDLTDRRFHGESIACPKCGPQLKFADAAGVGQALAGEAFDRAVQVISNDGILALKGLGGCHLACDATEAPAIELLRQRKQRPNKPLAVMMADMQQVEAYFDLSAIEAEQLSEPAAPIVLLPKAKLKQGLPEQIAPNVAFIGVMLAYTPLHSLLLNAIGKPLVMTSGNKQGEPIAIENGQAISALNGIADGFLLHNREIVHRCDDSLLGILSGKPRLIRRARGYVPATIQTDADMATSPSVLAMGGDLKNCFALSKWDRVMLSSHNGDLADPECYQAVQASIQSHQELIDCSPDLVAVDMHPDYYSTRIGERLAHQYGVPVVPVQHHHAHHVACLIENNADAKQLHFGIIMDGLGYGDDGGLWGGELLLADKYQYQRLAHIKPFPLLGSDKANREPWRNLLALIGVDGSRPLLKGGLLAKPLQHLVQGKQAETLLNYQHIFPTTSSAGRLFDAVAALLDAAPLQQDYEGQAAMALQALAMQAQGKGQLPPDTVPSDAELAQIIEQGAEAMVINPGAIIEILVAKLVSGSAKPSVALAFHHILVAAWVAVLEHAAPNHPGIAKNITLSGGVLQNQIIHNLLERQLQDKGWRVYSHSRVPANDGGIALGQVAIAQAKWEKGLCV